MAKAVFLMVGNVTDEFVNNSLTKSELGDQVNHLLSLKNEFIQLKTNDGEDAMIRTDKIIHVTFSEK